MDRPQIITLSYLIRSLQNSSHIHSVYLPGILCITFFLALSSSALYAQNVDTKTESENTVYLPLTFPGKRTNALVNPPESAGEHSLEIVNIFISSQTQLNRLAAEIDVWEEGTHNRRRFITAMVFPSEKEKLLRDGFRLETNHALMEQYARTLRLFGRSWDTMLADQTTAAQIDVQSIPGFACYRTVEETHSDLEALAAFNPNLASWIDIGDSWDKYHVGGPKGNNIYALILSNKSMPGPKPKFMLIAAIHGREYTTAETATRFAEYLIGNYGVDADVTWLLDYHEIHVLPQTNPDGRKVAEAGQLWRKNRNDRDGCTSPSQFGVDLNRNSSFKWGLDGGSSSDACSQTYRGRAPASEPEVRAIQEHALSIFPDRRGPQDADAAPLDTSGLFVSLHSFSELVLPAWGWTSLPSPNQAEIFTLGRKFGYYTGYKVCSAADCLYPVSGTTDDWTYGELGIASYTFELGTDFFESCTSFEEEVYPNVLDSLIYAAKAARLPYIAPAGPEAVSLQLAEPEVAEGTPVTLGARIDDGRFASNGGDGVEPVQNVSAARYSIDLPSWAGGELFPMQAADGAFDGTAEDVSAVINTENLSEGRHVIFVEGKDVDGNWGVPSAIFLTIEDDDDETPEPTPTATTNPPSETPTVAPVPSHTPTATPIPTIPPSNEGCTIVVSSDVPKPLPHGTTSISSSLSVAASGTIHDLNVEVDLFHSWVGDLTIRLQHQESGKTATLLERPGIPGEPWGCSQDHLNAIFDDEATLSAEEQCSPIPPAIGGEVRPHESLGLFQEIPKSGTWTLIITDSYLPADVGNLNSWSLEFCSPGVTTPVPTPTQTPTHTSPPPTHPPTATPLPPSPTAAPGGSMCVNFASDGVPVALPVGTTLASSSISVLQPMPIQDLNVNVDVSHDWVGDVALTLLHQASGTTISLLDRPGIPGGFWGCSQDDIVATFDDEASVPAETQCNTSGSAISGSVVPAESLASFDGLVASGTWVLQVTDAYPSADGGVLNHWSLEICSDDMN